MRKLLLLSLIFTTMAGYSQNVGIGTTTPNIFAKLEVADTAMGILIPRISSVQRVSIPNTRGLLVYDTTSNSFWYNNGNIWKNMEASDSGWLLQGNAGTSPLSDFIGTIDNTPLNIRVNNVKSGLIDQLNQNTFWGYQSGRSITAGINNTATGYNSLYSDTTGNFNAAHGSYALYSNGSGNYNTAMGGNALYSNTTGTSNTANGFSALHFDTTGDFNSATGTFALYSNNSSFNTAMGAYSLHANTSGLHNSALGFQSLFIDSSGNFNTASGSHALFSNKVGNYNVAHGYQAGFSDSSGNDNTAIGSQALFLNKTSNNNTAIGKQALFTTTAQNNTAVGFSALMNNTSGENNIAIGANAGTNIFTSNNNIMIGNGGGILDANTIRIGTAQTSAYLSGIFGATSSGGIQVLVNASGQLGTVLSSGSFKENISDMDAVSKSLYKLRPVVFQYKKEVADDRSLQYGLIAEEVEKVDPRLVAYDKDGKVFTVKYHLLTPLLLNELQKEHAINIEQQKVISEQGKVNQSLQEQIDELKKLIKN